MDICMYENNKLNYAIKKYIFYWVYESNLKHEQFFYNNNISDDTTKCFYSIFIII